MFNLSFTLSIFLLAVSFVTCATPQYGLTLRNNKEKFTIFRDGSVATNIVENSDGSVSWVASAAGGAGGGLAFYVKSNKEEINIANYESVDLELDYSPVNGKWNGQAQNPSFVFRILPWDSTGMFGGFEDVEYFNTRSKSGSLTYTVKIPSNFSKQIIASSDFDSVLGFAIKFNDYQRGNSDGDQLKVTLKNVKFNAKSGAAEDKPFDDGLTDSQRGTVVEINYPTRDYTVDQSRAQKYNKHGWVYLPAGYDADDKNTQYPLFVLLHGFGQNENTWGLSNKGRGGKIKGFMDRGMASGDVGRFILVCVTGVASRNWGPNGAGNDVNGFNAFKGELRDDIIPYMRSKFNIKSGRDNVALAGLSMGGGQTFNIGIAECLDLISNFAGFSGAMFSGADEFKRNVDNKREFNGLKIHNLYMTCGDKDDLVYSSFPGYVRSMKSWSRVENFKDYTYPGGTHDFPVWYKGFNDFIHMIFPEMREKIEPKEQPQPTLEGTCSSKILAQGYPCCSDNCTVVYTDDDGTWGVENGQWCGCGGGKQKTCTGAQGYPCCKTATQVYFSDNDGDWSVENNNWCLIP
ncbi:alpha/beta-hydrolase [Anaeromyces robustus]|jgi:enterochelin esterase-like enzyme|uniref:Alpha/beta-hydrolase n=1 Tax=Anaeromyces robustus TaxID=1754192 RepID=A0A1Y1XE27_9FUNG|nr:alpha/beta-hydrolase [Anaeromyces robustus]|eukprot:ORX83634.1 alpha/beta-hydrolase [Anaeromyces robustus]